MEAQYTGFWKRLVAALVDGFILGLFLAVLVLCLAHTVKLPALTREPIVWSVPTVTIGMAVYTFQYGAGCVLLADAILAAVGLVIVSVIAMGHGSGNFWSVYGLLVVIPTLVNWLYHAIMESSAKQATLGKLLLKIRVTDLDGQRISLGKATARHFSKTISTLALLIGFLMAGWTKKKQALHDKIAKCLVVRQPPSSVR